MFLCTDLALEPVAILSRFVFRWRIETTFQEVREHLGVEDATAVVRSGHLAHDPGTARAVLSDHRLGARVDGNARYRRPAASRDLV